MVKTLEGFLELVEMRDNRFVWQWGDLRITTNPETLTKEEIKRGRELLDRMEFQLKTGIKLKNECKTELCEPEKRRSFWDVFYKD